VTRAARVGAPPPPAGPPPRSVALSDPVSLLPGIGSARAARLAEAGLTTVAHVLRHLPFRYEDRRRFAKVAELAPGEPATLFVRLAGAKGYRMRRGGMRVEALADDGSEAIRVVWHNRYPSFLQAAQSGRSAVLFGAPAVTPRGELRLENPETETFDAGEETDPVHSGRIVGVYHRVAGVSSRPWRTLVRRVLDALSPAEKAAGLPPEDVAPLLAAAHFPGSFGAAEEARRRLAGEELSVLAARIEDKRERLRRRQGLVLPAGPALREAARAALPFSLTGAQRRAVREIAADMASGRAMARLLQGDVGSGKTVVAGLALLLAARNGAQGALMAPTEILAEQLAESLAAWLSRAGVRLGLLTGRVRGRPRAALLAALAAGELDVLVGTHALLESPVAFRKLSLVVVDEQHRFGVAHRARLFAKGEAPHVLVMTATPIPRSLAWAIYGELDVSILDEKPPGRAAVITRVRDAEARPAVYRFAAERVAAGERVYVVVPAIEEGAREVAAVQATARRIEEAEPGLSVGVVHGRMRPEDRSRVMAAFARGDVGLLVATTVVEVGVDIPEATFMVVENAEAFGLAQLHQLRGRVGRSKRSSWCALVVGKAASPEARGRLSLLERTADGFEIAEKDLEARGPGDLLGTRQSGLPPLRIADPVRDLARLGEARREVVRRREAGGTIASDLFGYGSDPLSPPGGKG
jgi:ATP-dependent DNA helicase RecG